MKNLFFVILIGFGSIVFFSCGSRSGHLVEQKKKEALQKKQDSISQEKRFRESLVIQGIFYVNGEEGETSPYISFGVTSNTLVLMESNLENGEILEASLKLKDIMEKQSFKDFQFKKDKKGYIYFGFDRFKDPIKESKNLIDLLAGETNWKLYVSDWKTTY